MSTLGTMGVHPNQADVDPTAQVGARGRTNAGSWVYGQANGAISQYDVVKIDNDGQLIPLDNTVSGAEPTAVGVAQVAVADNEYAWVWIGEGGGTMFPDIKVNVLASTTADVKLYTSGTAGSINDVTGDLIQGLTITEDDGGSGSAVNCYSPCVLMTNGQD